MTQKKLVKVNLAKNLNQLMMEVTSIVNAADKIKIVNAEIVKDIEDINKKFVEIQQYYTRGKDIYSYIIKEATILKAELQKLGITDTEQVQELIDDANKYKNNFLEKTIEQSKTIMKSIKTL